MSTVNQKNRTDILRGIFSNFCLHSYARWKKTLSFHDTANPHSPKHLMSVLLAEPQVLARPLCMVAESKAGHVFNQRSNLIWKFLQMPTSRKKQMAYSITHSNKGLRQENSHNPFSIFQIFSH